MPFSYQDWVEGSDCVYPEARFGVDRLRAVSLTLPPATNASYRGLFRYFRLQLQNSPWNLISLKLALWHGYSKYQITEVNMRLIASVCDLSFSRYCCNDCFS